MNSVSGVQLKKNSNSAGYLCLLYMLQTHTIGW